MSCHKNVNVADWFKIEPLQKDGELFNTIIKYLNQALSNVGAVKCKSPFGEGTLELNITSTDSILLASARNFMVGSFQ